MPKQSTPLNQVFQALADPTRRAVLERLGSGPASTSELAQPFAMALPSFAQHLAVLENCGLVHSRKTGRTRIYRLAPRPPVYNGMVIRPKALARCRRPCWPPRRPRPACPAG